MHLQDTRLVVDNQNSYCGLAFSSLEPLSFERLHKLTRADCTTRNRRKADSLRRAYDDLELRIAALREQEELDSMRPDLDGNAIIELLGIKPGPAVGEAYRYLLELRVERGPLGPDAAREELLAWWGSRSR